MRRLTTGARLCNLRVMKYWKRIRGGLVLALLALLAVAVGLLPGACTERESTEAALCFTPVSVSLVVDDTLTLFATIKTEGVTDRKLNEESGWRWVSDSDDGGEIEFSDETLHWLAQEDHIYIAQVVCTARGAGTVTVEIDQPADQTKFDVSGEFNCEESCTITITTFLSW